MRTNYPLTKRSDKKEKVLKEKLDDATDTQERLKILESQLICRYFPQI